MRIVPAGLSLSSLSASSSASISSNRWPTVPRRPSPASVAALVPMVAVVFVGFLVSGLAMPVLPLHVHQGLGLGTFVVGLVTGSQFAAAVLSRVWAGRHSDTRGAKHAVVTGLVIAAAAGL